MFIRDLQTVQNWGPCTLSDAFLGKYIQFIEKSLQQKHVFI